jgi:hypothetical protein
MARRKETTAKIVIATKSMPAPVSTAAAFIFSAGDLSLLKIVFTGWFTTDFRGPLLAEVLDPSAEAAPDNEDGVPVLVFDVVTVVGSEFDETPLEELLEDELLPEDDVELEPLVEPELLPEDEPEDPVVESPCGTAPPFTNSQSLQGMSWSEFAFRMPVQSTFSCSFKRLPLPELSPTIQPYFCSAVATILAADDSPLLPRSTLGLMRTTIPSGTMPPLLFSCPTIGQ